MHIQRRQELKWELIDTLFTKWEYWDESMPDNPLSYEEVVWMKKTINSIAKKLGVDNHVLINY